MKTNRKIEHNFDYVVISNKVIEIAGWAFGSDGLDEVTFVVEDEYENKIDYTLKRMVRPDVSKHYSRNEEEISGFVLKFESNPERKHKLIMKAGKDVKVVRIVARKPKANKGFNFKKFAGYISKERFERIYDYAKKNGLKKTFSHTLRKLKNFGGESYEDWFKSHKATKIELENQRSHKFDYEPMISIIVPTYNTPKDFLCQMIDSVVEQTYGNWELCIADGKSTTAVADILKEYAAKDNRIKYALLTENAGISGNTNKALELATGDYVALLDHDDLLAPDALYEVVKVINEDGEVEAVYTDEDKVSLDLKTHFQPHFKSDYNIDLLRSNNYICHFFVIKKAIVDEVGGFRSEYDGSQDYDFIFRCTTRAKKVAHIPRILYYWRMHQNSVAENPESKMYAFDAGKRAIEYNLSESGLKGEVSHLGILGFYKVKYEVTDNKKVSIIIPNKDEKETLAKCIESVLNKTLYDNYEIVIVENNSTTDEIFEYYKEIEKNDKVKVVTWKEGFNYSAINNYGVSCSDGEYILLLNNDTEVINEDWLAELVGFIQREDVGIVGGKLIYPDDTVQHAGVVIGLGGIAGHAHLNIDKDEPGYFARAIVQQDVSAVTGACLMTKRSVYEEVSGLEEDLKVAFNDIDFCLKVREAGYKIIYNPQAKLYHYESKSRGAEDTLDKKLRFESEIEYIQNKWGNVLENDPYYNVNLSKETIKSYTLREDLY